MSEESDNKADASQMFMESLKESGFFTQIGELESNLKTIAKDLTSLGEIAGRRLEETESLAAHVLAIESALRVLIRKHPIDAEDVRAEIIEKTAALTGNEDGSPVVLSIVDELFTKN